MLLLDEPFGALEATVRQRLRVDTKKWQRELKIPTILVTHDHREALEMGDRVAIMNKGRFEQVDTSQNIYNNPATRFVAQFIGRVNLFSSWLEPNFGHSTQDAQLGILVSPKDFSKLAWNDHALEELLRRAEAQTGRGLPLLAEARVSLIAMADGDGRYLLNLSEEIFALTPDGDLDTAGLTLAVQRRAPLYDKSQEGHYNLISALHKSLRGSDADAALYWLARMLAGGEAPIYIARRLVRFATEDIGLADPQALVQALAAWDAYDRLGTPEGELALAQAVLYLATAPKSNAAYSAFKGAQRAARETGSLAPPAHILNAPTNLMRDLGYGKGYEYDHDTSEGFSGQDYFPEGLARPRFYDPAERGFERDIRKRLDYWDRLRRERNN